MQHLQPHRHAPSFPPSKQVTKPAPAAQPTISASPTTPVMAPASVTLTAPAGFASYAWATDGGCTGVTLAAAASTSADTLTLTSGFSSTSVFDLSADATLSCGFKVTVTDAYGTPATSSATPITVRPAGHARTCRMQHWPGAARAAARLLSPAGPGSPTTAPRIVCCFAWALLPREQAGQAVPCHSTAAPPVSLERSILPRNTQGPHPQRPLRPSRCLRR